MKIEAPCYRKGHQTVHPNAKEIPYSQEGNTVKMQCPNCGMKWRKELPQ